MTKENTTVENVEETVVDTVEETTQPEEKTYTQAELEGIVSKRVAREQKVADKKVEEAQKLAKMNESEAKQYEFEQLQTELADYKKKDAYYGLSKEASKMLAEHSINADDDLLSFVVKDDATATKAAVDSFVGLVNSRVEEGVKKALSGNGPRVNQSAGKTVTKESVMGIRNSAERIKAIQDNPQLFKK